MLAVSIWGSQSRYNPLSTGVVHSSLGKPVKVKRNRQCLSLLFELSFTFLEDLSPPCHAGSRQEIERELLPM